MSKEKVMKCKLKYVFLFIICGVLSIIVLNYGISLKTGKNYIEVFTKNLLTSLKIYTEEIQNVEIASDGWDRRESGSWHIDKSADWTGTNIAQVTFNLDSVLIDSEIKYRDVIFVLDVSGSMSGDKLNRVKSDSIELVNYILSDSNNNVALINFDTSSKIISSFTNDLDSITNEINNMEVGGSTNYNAALNNVLEVLNGYEKSDDREVIVLFLTDGYPNEDSPNQVATYAKIKEEYPYVTIDGIQYEMGKDIIEDIINISDYQYYADMEILNNVLFEAAINPDYYENFEIVDYIENDYFYLDSIDDVEVSIGTVSLEEENGHQRVVWKLVNYRTGNNEKMVINLTLKDNYISNEGFYPTNEKEVITSKIKDEEENIINSALTPVLNRLYKVIYDTNTPTGCNLDNIDSDSYAAFEVVTKKDDELVCDGYLFKGWEIEDSNVERIGSEYFIMPSHDVTIRAIWSKYDIVKTMDGTVNEKATLYRLIESKYKSGSTNIGLYTGNGADEYYRNVYYYTGDTEDNNLIFAGFCWKIVRTTDTGGVKIIYNGVPSSSGTCDNTGEDSQIGTSAYAIAYASPAYAGYMYNTVYSTSYLYAMEYTNYNSVANLPLYTLSVTNSNNYYFATSYSYSDGVYTLTNPVQLGKWSSIYKSVSKGYYTCGLTTTDTCSTLYYVIGGVSGSAYTLAMSGGKRLDDVNTNMILGSQIIDNGDGTYTLSGTIKTIKKSDWYSNYSSYENYYICDGYVNTTCSGSYMYRIKTPSVDNYTYIKVANVYKFGNDVEYDTSTGTYKLIDTDIAKTKSFYDYKENYTDLGYTHYTCLNTSGVCSSVYYVYYYADFSPFFITLSGGKKIEDALKEMLSNDDVNTNDSAVKAKVDEWYAANMTSYTDYLEDAVYCNDRGISSLGSWDPNGGVTDQLLLFNGYTSSNDLTCSNEIDKFTVNSSKGNGALTYPVGLLSQAEASLMSTSVLNTGEWYWLLTPFVYNANYTSMTVIDSAGNIHRDGVMVTADGVRPVVSLKAGIEYVSGDGTVNNPYVVS